MSSFKKLVDAVMEHGEAVIGETDQSIWTALNWMDRRELEDILASVGIASHPSESDDVLKQAIVSNIEDGTLDPGMVLGESMNEDSPPGFKGTVKSMKKHKDIDNPYALSWWMKNKGYKSHKKASGAAKESIRVNHPVHGFGTVQAITESHIDIMWDNLEKRVQLSNVLPFSEAKYLTRLRENYTDNPKDAEVGSDDEMPIPEKKGKGKKNMKRQKVDESMVAVGMAAIGGTARITDEEDLDLDSLTLEDLMFEDEWKKPWEEDKGDDDSGEDNSRSQSKDSEGRSGLRDAENTRDYDGADYTNVPRPSDSVLTNQDDQPSYDAEPLATMAGYEDATDGLEPDGDYATDLVPPDAPDVPEVRDLEGTSERHNTRDTGEGDDTQEAGDDNVDYEGDKPEDSESSEEDNQMKKYESQDFDLNAEDLGLTEMEHGEGMSGYAEDEGMYEHDMGAGEIAFTREFLDKLCAAISSQAPDESKCQALCDGLEAAQQEKGDEALDVSDWDSVKSHAASAYGGGDEEGGGYDDGAMGGDEGGYDDMGGDEDGYDDAGGDEGYDDVEGTEESSGDDGYDYDYDEDRAEGDGKTAGPEGGHEHEGKTQMMDKKGGKPQQAGGYDDNRGKDQRMQQRRKQKKDKRAGRYMEDGSGTPIGTGSNSGPGGGSTNDLSKPKKYSGKAVGTQTGSGPGGANTSDDGQKPTKDGGSNLLPAQDQGSSLGAAENPFSKGSPNPQNKKALAAENRKRKAKGKQKLDEAIMLGMSAIPGMGGDIKDVDIPPEAYDDDDELKMIKRRAGMDNWWK